MRRWIPFFPEFAECIRRKVSTVRVHYKPSTNEYYVAPGTWFAPGDFLITMLMDGAFYPTSKPLQGPDRDPPPSLEEYLYIVPDPVPNPTTHEERLNIVGDPLHS